MKFMLALEKGEFGFNFHGETFDERQDGEVAEMLTAMKEGLEANGYTVHAYASVETQFPL